MKRLRFTFVVLSLKINGFNRINLKSGRNFCERYLNLFRYIFLIYYTGKWHKEKFALIGQLYEMPSGVDDNILPYH